MARQNRVYDADTDTYRALLRRDADLDRERRAVQQKARALSKEAWEAGADSGAIALARRLRQIADPEKRRAKLREYARILIDLEDEILGLRPGHNGGPVMESEERPKTHAVPEPSAAMEAPPERPFTATA